MKGDLYIVIYAVVLYMKISIVLLFVHNIICLNCYLINCDLNNLFKAICLLRFHKPHVLYFPPFMYLSMKTMSVGWD
jgi:hypothetical protein